METLNILNIEYCMKHFNMETQAAFESKKEIRHQ